MRFSSLAIAAALAFSAAAIHAAPAADSDDQLASFLNNKGLLDQLGSQMEQVRKTVGERSAEIVVNAMGFLGFFNTMRRTFSHVGIYIGDNKFIHSPKPGSEVRVEDMRLGYWQRRFDGARRVESEAQIAQ